MARFLHLPSPDEPMEEDPLAGIANLFDVSVVFIVGLMITLFSVYRIGDLVDIGVDVLRRQRRPLVNEHVVAVAVVDQAALAVRVGGGLGGGQ